MPRYELSDDTSVKFWEYVVLETRLFTCAGADSAKGRVAIKDFDCPASARREANKRKKEKLSQGYKKKSEKRKKARQEKRDATIEAAISQDPDDENAYAIYADWLQAQGEPRGEFIALHNAVRDSPSDKHLQMAMARLMHAERAQMLPPLLYKALDKSRKNIMDAKQCRVTWSNGFIRSVRLGRSSDEKTAAAELLAEVLGHNSGRFLYEVQVADVWESDYAPLMQTLARGGDSLRVLRIGDFSGGSLQAIVLDEIAPLLKSLPHLHTLVLGAASITFDSIDAPKVRELGLASPAISAQTLAALATADWPQLQRLTLDFHHENVDWSVLAPMFEKLPRLEHLAITRTANTQQLWASLSSSGLVAQLRHLAVTNGDLEDSAIGDVDALRHLEHLDLARHHLSDAMVASLAATGVKTFIAVHQRVKGARAALTEAEVRGMTTESNFKRGRALAKPAKFNALGRDGNLLWGAIHGSSSYQLFVRLAQELDSACTCSSQFYPCKHLIALMLLDVQSHEFPSAPPPAGLVQDAENERYVSIYE